MADAKISEDDAGNLVITTPLLGELQGIRTDQAAGFARMSEALKGKADKADVAKLESRLDEHGKSISALQTWRHDKELAGGVHQQRDNQVFSRRQKVYASIGAAALVVATVMGPVIANVVTGH